jgi:hypothetical protein
MHVRKKPQSSRVTVHLNRSSKAYPEEEGSLLRAPIGRLPRGGAAPPTGTSLSLKATGFSVYSDDAYFIAISKF